MNASFWVQKHSRRIVVSDQIAVGVMVEIADWDGDVGKLSESTIICLGKGEARALASAIMGAAAEL